MYKLVKLQLEALGEVFRSLDGQSRICNWLLDKANALRQEFIQTRNTQLVKTLYTERGLRNLLPSLKEEHPFLKSVHSSPLKNGDYTPDGVIESFYKVLLPSGILCASFKYGTSARRTKDRMFFDMDGLA